MKNQNLLQMMEQLQKAKEYDEKRLNAEKQNFIKEIKRIDLKSEITPPPPPKLGFVDKIRKIFGL
jgi:hypothetical protein